jgi:hypothetical protein
LKSAGRKKKEEGIDRRSLMTIYSKGRPARSGALLRPLFQRASRQGSSSFSAERRPPTAFLISFFRRYAYAQRPDEEGFGKSPSPFPF